MSERPAKGALRGEYRFFLSITTRWEDNDLYGHVNNVVYYAYFDTVANWYLIREGGLDIHGDRLIGLVISSNCTYHSPLAYPDRLEGGLRVNRLGTTSVEYGIAIFREGAERAAAEGSFVHVFVDRQTNAKVPIPQRIRDALELIRA